MDLKEDIGFVIYAGRMFYDSLKKLPGDIVRGLAERWEDYKIDGENYENNKEIWKRDEERII